MRRDQHTTGRRPNRARLLAALLATLPLPAFGGGWQSQDDRPRLSAPVVVTRQPIDRDSAPNQPGARIGAEGPRTSTSYSTLWPEYREDEASFLRTGGHQVPLPSRSYRDRSFRFDGGDELPPPVELPPPGAHAEIAAVRERPFVVDYIYLGESDVDFPATDVRMSELGMSYQARLPLHERFQLTLRPFFDVMFLKGPGGPTPILPPQLYKVAIDLQGDIPITARFGLSLGITPGMWTDFDRVNGSDFRLPARALVTARVNDRLAVAAGVLYTDNIRRNLLPAVGLFWSITDRTRLELLFPRSRVVYKIHEEWEVYAAAERGGDTYNISAVNQDENFEYRDYRVMLGTQIDAFERFSFFAEAGVAFARKFRFDIQPEANIDSTFLVRVGTRF